MSITRFAINHTVSVYALIVALIIGGLLAYQSLPREAAPDIAIPVVMVNTPYFGVSPADIEMLITTPLERQFRNLRSLDQMTSMSAESASLVTLEFTPDVDIEDALQRIRSELDKVKPDLPLDAEDPEIIEINASDWPILVANIAGDMDPLRLKDLAEDLQDDLEAIPGVLQANLAGGVEREIQINLDPEKLRQHGVSPNQVVNAVQAENINLPGGTLDIGSLTYIVRVSGEFRQIEPIRHIIVSSEEGEPVYLRDVASVFDGFKDPETYSRLTTWVELDDGTRQMVTKPNISLAIVKRAGENIVSIAHEAKDIIEGYSEAAGDEVQITIVNDMSQMIENTVHELENNIISGMILVLLVLFFFMGGLRNALFVAISIPLSMLITFLVLAMLGVTLNMVVLFSLLLALGMLVDNAIVIVENIYRHASEGKDRKQAALDGTSEVGWAVIASTATTVAAFLPMLFWPGIMGEFMGFLPLTVIVTLLSSLFVALVINPTICATFLKVKPGKGLAPDTVNDLPIYRIYGALLRWSLQHRLIVGVLVVAAFIATFMIFGQFSRGVEFFPETTPEEFNVELTMPDGTNLERTNDVLTHMQAPLFDAPDLVDAWITDAGTMGGGRMGGGGSASHYGQITVDLKSIEEQPSSPYDFMDHLREYFAHIPGAQIILRTQGIGPPTGEPISIEIAGHDLTTLASISQRIRDQIRTIPGITDLKDDIELTRPEIHVDIDRQRAVMLQLSTQAVAQTVRTAIHGAEAGVFREDDDEFDIMIRFDESHRLSIEDIEHLTVVNPDGVHIPILEVANVEVRGGSGSIRRKAQERVVTITANAAEGFLPNALLAEISEKIQPIDLPAGYELRFTGEQDDQKEAADFLSKALLAALLLIGLILITEFNSIVQPFIILFSVLLSLIGVLWSLIITGMPLGIIMTGIGIISLAGVVVNNAIVLIDYINQLRDRGMDRRQAVITACLVRFRPVMLTAITTMLGLLPIVLGISVDFVNQKLTFGGMSVEMWGPMGTVVTGGLLVATVLTLIVVPVMYSVFDDISRLGQRLLRRLSALGLVLTMMALILPAISHAQDDPNLIPRRDLDDINIETQSEILVERTLTLAQARELVRDNAFDVQLAQTQVALAEGVIRQAYAAVLPNFSAGANYTLNQDEILLDIAPDNLPPGFEMPPAIIQPRSDYRWSLTASLGVNFRAWPGIQQSYARRDFAQAQVDLTIEALDDAVIQSYFNLLLLRRTIDLAIHQLASAQTLFDFTQRQFDAGTTTEFELVRAELELQQRRHGLESARQQFIQYRKAFAEILQTDDDFDVDLPPTVLPPTGDPDDLLERAEQHRAPFRADHLQQEIAQWARRDIFYSYLPSLSATFTFGGGKSTALAPGDPRWTLTFGAEWLLWDGGMREAQLDQTRAQLVATQISAAQTRHRIESEIDQARAEISAAKTQIESALTQIELAQRSLDQAEVSYQYGVASQLDVINARDQLQFASLSLIQQQLHHDLAVYRYLATIDGVDPAEQSTPP